MHYLFFGKELSHYYQQIQFWNFKDLSLHAMLKEKIFSEGQTLKKMIKSDGSSFCIIPHHQKTGYLLRTPHFLYPLYRPNILK